MSVMSAALEAGAFPFWLLSFPSFRAVGAWIAAFCPGEPIKPALELGMPRTLAEVGVEQTQFRQIAEYTLLDIWGRTNPRPVRTADDVMQILNLAA